MTMIKKKYFNEDILIKDDCSLGFNKKGMLKIGAPFSSSKVRKWTYYLGSTSGKQYYWQRNELPRRRVNIFM